VRSGRHRAASCALAAALAAAAGCTGGTVDPGGGDTGGRQDAGPPADTGEGEGEGEPEGPAALLCQERCDEDDDCRTGYKCLDHRCAEESSLECAKDLDCVAVFSYWSTPCDGPADCPDQVCVAFGARGRCAARPDITPCADLTLVEVDMDEHNSDSLARVCASENDICGHDNRCAKRCETDEGCIATAYPSCNTATGRCECTPMSCDYNATDCVDGRCRCTRDEDCTGGDVDVCYEGTCGCSSADVCPPETVHLHTTVVCERWFIPGGAR